MASRSANARSQSAMEYLMTYGWAILVISIVLAALWQLGVFNSAAQAPRAQPGSCRAMRNQAVGGGVQTVLEGSCGGLLPQFVASFGGVDSNIVINGTAGLPVGNTPFSFFTWINVPSSNGGGGIVFCYGTDWEPSGVGEMVGLGFPCTTTACTPEFADGGGGGVTSSTATFPTNKWNFVGWTYDGASTLDIYINGVQTPFSIAPENIVLDPNSPTTVGAERNGPPLYGFVTSQVSNMQLYNTTLSPGEVKALYNEGIGGAPLPLPSLVGWWPLNGNTKDYSPSKNNGYPYNVVMSSTWASTYVVH